MPEEMQREGKIILRTVFEDGRPGDHMEIIVYEMNFDESDLNFHSEDVCYTSNYG